MSDLKRACAPVDESSALNALEDFAGKWDKKYPNTILKSEYNNRFCVAFYAASLLLYKIWVSPHGGGTVQTVTTPERPAE